MSMSPHDHGQTKLHKWTQTQKLHTNIGKQLLSEIVARAVRRHIKRGGRDLPFICPCPLACPRLVVVSTVCGHSQGSGAPPSRLAHAAES